MTSRIKVKKTKSVACKRARHSYIGSLKFTTLSTMTFATTQLADVFHCISILEGIIGKKIQLWLMDLFSTINI